jgi:hypothetical protein
LVNVESKPFTAERGWSRRIAYSGLTFPTNLPQGAGSGLVPMAWLPTRSARAMARASSERGEGNIFLGREPGAALASLRLPRATIFRPYGAVCQRRFAPGGKITIGITITIRIRRGDGAACRQPEASKRAMNTRLSGLTKKLHKLLFSC